MAAAPTRTPASARSRGRTGAARRGAPPAGPEAARAGSVRPSPRGAYVGPTDVGSFLRARGADPLSDHDDERIDAEPTAERAAKGVMTAWILAKTAPWLVRLTLWAAWLAAI